MKKWILVLSMLLATACARSGVHSTAETPPTKSGGSSDGGGNVLGSDEKEVNLAIAGLKTDLHNVVHRLTYWAQGPQAQPGNPFSFLLDPKVDQVIDAMKINVQQSSCSSTDTTHLAGSANPNTQSICLSLTQLEKTGPLEAMQWQVLALGVHELTHLLGGDEVQAQWLQQWIASEQSITKVFDGGARAHDVIINLIATHFRLVLAMDAIADHSSSVKVCHAITVADESLDSLVNTMNDYPPSVLQAWKALPSANYVNLANSLCSDQSPSDPAAANAYLQLAGSTLAHLKALAQKISDYDSVDHRMQKYVDQMQ